MRFTYKRNRPLSICRLLETHDLSTSSVVSSRPLESRLTNSHSNRSRTVGVSVKGSWTDSNTMRGRVFLEVSEVVTDVLFLV